MAPHPTQLREQSARSPRPHRHPQEGTPGGQSESGWGSYHPSLYQQGIPGGRLAHRELRTARAAAHGTGTGTAWPGNHGPQHGQPERRAPSHGERPSLPHPSCGRGPGRPTPGTRFLPLLSRRPLPLCHKHGNYRLRRHRPGRRQGKGVIHPTSPRHLRQNSAVPTLAASGTLRHGITGKRLTAPGSSATGNSGGPHQPRRCSPDRRSRSLPRPHLPEPQGSAEEVAPAGSRRVYGTARTASGQDPAVRRTRRAARGTLPSLDRSIRHPAVLPGQHFPGGAGNRQGSAGRAALPPHSLGAPGREPRFLSAPEAAHRTGTPGVREPRRRRAAPGVVRGWSCPVADCAPPVPTFLPRHPQGDTGPPRPSARDRGGAQPGRPPLTCSLAGVAAGGGPLPALPPHAAAHGGADRRRSASGPRRLRAAPARARGARCVRGAAPPPGRT